MAPRNVRNFWIEVEVEGKKGKIATGPRGAGGGMSITLRVRENGAISEFPIFIDCTSRLDGALFVEASVAGKTTRLYKGKR